jgi:hypothetical protein
MGFFSFLVLLIIAYLVWRVTDQLPDLIFRMSEIQRDVAEIRRAQTDSATRQPVVADATAPSPPPPPPPASTADSSSAGRTGSAGGTSGSGGTGSAGSTGTDSTS